MGVHDPATCPCNKCSTARHRAKDADAVSRAAAAALEQASGPKERVVQEVVAAENLPAALERIYFGGNFVIATVPAGIFVDERRMAVERQGILTFTEFRVIYIPGKFL